MTTTSPDTQRTPNAASAAARKTHVCPWWVGYFLVSPVRRLFESPERLLAPHLEPGARVLDFGSAMGYFSIPAARLVGPTGRVVCVDIQERMLKALRRRAKKSGVSERIETVLAAHNGDWLGDRTEAFDLALLFYVVHELPDPPATFAQIVRALKPGGRVLLAEPSGHVSSALFKEELAQAGAAGLRATAGPRLRRSRTALLERT